MTDLATQIHEAHMRYLDLMAGLAGTKKGKAKSQARTGDEIECKECGGTFKMLTKHLRHAHSLTPIEYFDKHGLPHDSPLSLPMNDMKQKAA